LKSKQRGIETIQPKKQTQWLCSFLVVKFSDMKDTKYIWLLVLLGEVSSCSDVIFRQNKAETWWRRKGLCNEPLPVPFCVKKNCSGKANVSYLKQTFESLKSFCFFVSSTKEFLKQTMFDN